MKNPFLFVVVIAFVFIAGCNGFGKQKKPVIRDTSINQTTSFNNLFFDSIQVEQFLSSHPEFNSYSAQFRDFYKDRNYQFAWFDSKGITEQASHFMNLINAGISELQDSSLYHPKSQELYEMAINDSLHNMSRQDILQTEMMLTGRFFVYAAKIYKGSNLDAADLGWFIPRKKIDLKELLDSTIRSTSAEGAIFTALNPQYKKLEGQLAAYKVLSKEPETDTIPKLAKPLKKGDSSVFVVKIRKRLTQLGDLMQYPDSGIFDSTMEMGVRRFQNRMGLVADGVIGNKMIEELNVPIQQRIRQILINLERLRWMPSLNDSTFILVNIPEYKLHLYDSGRNLMNMNVIVGKAANHTVIFKANLKYIVFSPYWNVPPSIVRKELLPAINRNSNYLDKNHMEITGSSNGLPVIRQKPGPYNALGLVKFLFPNSYDIYLHDTPNRELFSQSARGLSHGCIRISEPKKMAAYLLRNDSTWNSSLIDSAMQLSKEKWVPLKRTVPVFIVYFTAWVDQSGVLNFRKDIYGHDEKMAAKLFTR